MMIHRRTLLLNVAALPLLTVAACAEQATPSPGSQVPAASQEVWTSGANLSRPPGLPDVGKWMLAPGGEPAHWLGERYRGKALREPINVIIIDEAARNAQDATARILNASKAAGYPIRFGHSTGYQAYVGGELYAQLPKGRDEAFSNEPFELSNNHGRIFGPYPTGGGYVFVAAFSREEVDPLRVPGHRYASFNRARDDFTQRLDEATTFKVSAFVGLDNAILNDPAVTTADHDGVAVLVRATE
jgi:hypothetical protein